MKIVSALVGLIRYETKSLTDIHQLKKQPLAPATKHLQTPKTRPCQTKNIALSSTQANPLFAPSHSPPQTTRYIICVKTLNN